MYMVLFKVELNFNKASFTTHVQCGVQRSRTKVGKILILHEHDCYICTVRLIAC